MHKFHAWLELSESAQEGDLGQLEDKVTELQELVADSRWHDAVFEVRNLNGGHFFTATGLINRRRAEG
jgi:surfactin synthase thioesterase subunit